MLQFAIHDLSEIKIHAVWTELSYEEKGHPPIFQQSKQAFANGFKRILDTFHVNLPLY